MAKTAPAPGQGIRGKTFDRDITTKLTKAQRDGMGEKIGTALERVQEVKDDFAEVKASWNAKIAAAELEVQRLGKAARTGELTQTVTCYEVIHENLNKAIIHRLADDTVVDERVLSAQERQQALDFKNPDDEDNDPDEDADDDDDEHPSAPHNETDGD